jgi:hypothetical protein
MTTDEPKPPLCPHCSASLVDLGDLPTFVIEDIETGLKRGRNNAPTFFWAVYCGNCGKLLGMLPPTPTEIKVIRR